MGYPPILLEYKNRIDEALKQNLSRLEGPSRLKEAMAYSLMTGGKRLKSVLLLIVRDLFPAGGPDPMPAACAFEYIHTYSLIHDDLPAMDNDDFRRGQPSNHKKFGEAMAILAGDALLAEAFVLTAGSLRDGQAELGARVLFEMAQAAGAAGMVGGQALDTLDTGRRVSRDELQYIHRMKTGALFRAAIRCGAILGRAGESELSALTAYAEQLGLAFQVADDILDETASTDELGKTAGKDRDQNKNTYVALLGLEESRVFAHTLVRDAVRALDPFGEAAHPLRELAAFVVERSN
ncbi:MAG: polyprenyl synthetase family protein [Myxococcales bacterium]|nr:MAG: polyprenyl synthetase family protein [Myxococcales bacterium]